MLNFKAKYKDKSYNLFAEIEYEGPKRMQIRITGTRFPLLLQNDWPLIKHTKEKTAIHWQIIEGKKVLSTPAEGAFIAAIYKNLEEYLKNLPAI